MASIEKTVEDICSASTFDARIAEIRKIPGKHGTDDRPAIFAQVARELYVPDLTPDFAYIHQLDFYDEPHFQRSGLTPFRRSGRYASRPVARGGGQGDWSDHDEQ